MADAPFVSDALANGSAPSLDGLLAGLVQNNPSLAWLPQLMAMRQQRELDQAPAPSEIDELRAALRQWQLRAEKMYRRARALEAELAETQDRLSDIAAALGACGLCWGEDETCPSCRGRGKPGHFIARPSAPRLAEPASVAVTVDTPAVLT
jgi:hypothetical protein